MSNAGTFGGWLKQRRKERGITLEELADRINCSRETLIKIEAGTRRPSLQIAQLLAEQFNIPADEREAFTIFARTGGTPPAPDLPAEGGEVAAHAPWRAAHRRKTNLPSMLTTLVGREQDAGAVRDLLLQPKARLLTLTGPPGIGKTRLALRVAHDLVGSGQFEDGVYFVELATVSDPALVLPTVAHTLGLIETTSQTIEETLTNYAQQRRLLLVLDNFEQVLDAAPVVVKLLESSPWSKALVTSREAMHVRGERRFPVPPLLLPDPEHLPPLEALEGYSAIELFVERAQAVAPGFALVEANSEDVAAVCLGLEGLPLAIELAAARADHLSPKQIRNALQSRLKLLTGGARDLPARHRTLKAAIEWSYDLLKEGEQKLFRRLSVFVGGRTAEAAEAICDADGDLGIETTESLGSLVDKSLLHQERTGEHAPLEDRFVMLEMIREYALERLEESGESRPVREAHAGFFLRLAEEAEPHLRGPQQIAWLRRLEAEHDNIRAALRWALESNAGEPGLRLVGTLRWFWTQRSHLTEGLQWANAVLAMPGAQGRTPARAKALWCVGVLAWFQNDPAARPLLEESVEIWREVEDKRGLAYSIQHLGMVLQQQSQPEIARPLLLESIELFQEAQETLGSVLSLAALSINMVALEDAGGNSPEAQKVVLEEAIQLAREIEDNWGLALALRNRAWVDIRRGDHAAARPLLKESLELQIEMGTKHEVAPILADLGQLAELEGNLQEAMELYEKSFNMYEDCADKRGVASNITSIGGVALLMGDIERARETLGEVLQAVKEHGSTRHSIAVLEAVGRLMGALGEPARASMLLAAAQAWYRPHAFSRPPAARAEYNGYLESARAGLDVATWQQAWARGEAMSIEEALRFASESVQAVSGTR